MKKSNRILSALLTLTIIFSMMLSSGQIISYAGSFEPIEGVGDADVTLPMADIEGTLIYSKSDFDPSVFGATTSKQLDSMIYHDKGTSSASSDSDVFVAPKQAYFTLENALNEYILENGAIDVKVHEVTFEMKSVNADVYLYPCGNSNNRDAKASLVFGGTRLTNDYNGQTYGTVPQDTWYEIKFTHDIRDQKVYVSINGAVVYSGVSNTVGTNFKSILYQQNDGTTTNIDNIRYVVKGETNTPEPPAEPDIGDGFLPIDGVGNPDVALPMEDDDGTVIYSKSDFSSDTYSANGQKQLDNLLYNDKGTSSAYEDSETNAFKFGKQGYFTLKNALDTYNLENDEIDVKVHEFSFSIKYTGANIYLYPCGNSNNRDAAGSLVIQGTRFTNDNDGRSYGTAPQDVWYRVKFTYDVENAKVYVSLNNAVVYSGTSSIIGSNFQSVLYQHGDGTNAMIDDITYVVKGEVSDDPSTPPSSPDEPDEPGDGGDTDEFAPVPGVGSTDIKIPLSDIEGTIIYSNGEFPAETYVASSVKQLDPMVYHEQGTSGVGTDETNGSVFSFGKQGYLTAKNALDAYVQENGNVPGAIHELKFDMKLDGGSVYIYPCGGGNSRDAVSSLVLRTTALTNDNDGASYGTLPSGKWYRFGFTLDTITGTVYVSVNGAVVYTGVSGILASSLYSILYQQTTDATVSIDNITYAIKGSTNIESVSVSGNSVFALTNDKLITTKDGKDIDFSKLVSLYCGSDEVAVDSVSYDVTKKEFTIKAKKPLISAFEYTIKLSDTIVSENGIYVRENYEYKFKTPSMAFDVDEVWEEGSTIKATVINTTGREKTVVMAVVGKNENGAITSMISTSKTVVGEDGLELQLTPDDENAITSEAFFIENWESGIPVKGGVYKGFCQSVPFALASNFVNASHILATNSIKISGIVGNSAGTAISLNMASEDSVKENGEILEFPFSDSNKPILSYVTQTGQDGVFSEEIIIPDTIDAGSYYFYIMSEEGSQYVNFFVLDSQDAQEVLDKFNEETNPSSLKSYISADGTMEKIGYSSEKIKSYYDIISDYTIFAKGEGYTLDTLRDAIDRSIALEKAKNGENISALMSEYASAFGGTYDDYANLSQDEKSCFESLIRSIDYKKDGVSLELSKLIVVAKARSSSSLWSVMKKFVTENADVIGADIGQGSDYASIPSNSQPGVFSKMMKNVKNVSTISEIKICFDNAVKAVKKEVASNNSGAGGSGGGGGGGASASLGDFNVGIVPDVKSEDEKLSGGFSDTFNHYSQEAVKFLSDKKIVNGYGDGTFRPDNFVTRAEFAKMIYGAFLIEGGNEVSFSDVTKSDWYYDSITNLASKGILLGDGTLFRPDELIMRQDATLIISRILSYFGFEYENDSTVFADDAYISDYAKDAVSKMKNAGIVVGNGLNFSPLSDITRGEAAVLVYRAFNERMEAVQ